MCEYCKDPTATFSGGRFEEYEPFYIDGEGAPAFLVWDTLTNNWCIYIDDKKIYQISIDYCPKCGTLLSSDKH